MFVKICGLTSAEGCAAAAAAGADAVGFVFAESPRRVSAARAAEICAALPNQVLRIAVMRHPGSAEWDEVRDVFDPDWLQTDAGDFAGLRLGEKVRALPVFRDDAADRLPQRLLFEGAHSGRGQVADWTQAARIATRTELVLAGGLTPDNVADAIRCVNPWGVDVSSGVEDAPGIKNPDKIAAFVRAARAAVEHAN